ncbi:MAG: 2-succinyl-5-enolpyruvyl-6-hydroxy-3-cyclohexene-carboxylic-acid synthase, partial [Cyanobacteriota bacterium]
NHGGGIFEWLPIAAHGDVFEPYFATPQTIDFAQLCQTYGVTHQGIPDLLSLKNALSQTSPTPIQVLELNGDRRAELAWLKRLQAMLIH